MARIERIRGYEFTDDVSVEVISRETYRERRGDGRPSQAWREQFWESLFIVGEDTTVDDAFGELYGSSVLGYYSGGDIVVVSDTPDDLRLSRGTLVHELEHALQDQRLGIGSSARTKDGRLAAVGVVEGDANYVETLYERRCSDGRFDCISVPEATGDSGGGDVNLGLSVATYVPYAEGEAFVARLHERGGWDAVDAAFADRPVSTEQLVHPDAYPDERPVSVSLPDRSSGEWQRLSNDGEPILETAGETYIYSMLWYAEVVPRDHLTATRSGVSRYTYDHPDSAGWGGDRMAFYTDGSDYGYVWKTTWDTTADAREFMRAYEGVLEANGADSRDDGVYVVPDGEFQDAFRVVRTGETVLVVNAPTVGDLDGVHAPAATGSTVTTDRTTRQVTTV
jgi:hypothetical protein